MVSRNRFETEFGRTVPMAKYAEYFERYQQHYRAQVRQLAAVFSKDCGADLQVCAGSPEPALRRALRDAWGTSLRVESLTYYPQKTYYLVRSAGPDKQFGTADDLTGYLEVRARKPVGASKSGASRIDVNIEHDRGPFNGLAEIDGSVVDQDGGALEGATVTARCVSNPAVRSTWVNASGQFSLAGIPDGEYEVKVSNGPETVSRHVTLQVRDRGLLSVVLRQKSSGSVVVVADPPLRVRRGGVVGGVPGGVMGGVVDGMVGGVAGERMFRPMAKAMASPMAVPHAPMPLAAPRLMAVSTGSFAKVEPAAPAARVRSYFPEALYINPEIVTDQNGVASITIPLADSITTWRMAMVASTMHGALGSGASSLKVFQDFFVDLDLPVTLTQGDRVSIPVAVYNYSAARRDVRLELKKEDWFALVDDNADKTVTVDAGQVGRIAVHRGGAAHRQIQADTGRAYERRK